MSSEEDKENSFIQNVDAEMERRMSVDNMEEEGELEAEQAWDELERLEELKKEYKRTDVEGQPSEWRDQRLRQLGKEIQTIKAWLANNSKTSTTGDPELPDHLKSEYVSAGESEGSVCDTKEKHVTNDELNYFIYEGATWRVRFKGGIERTVKDSVNIWTLVEFLDKPRREVVKDKMLKRTTIKEDEDDGEENRDQEPSHACNMDKMTDKDLRIKIEERYKELYEKDKAEAERMAKIVSKVYGAIANPETGCINWIKKNEKGDYDKIVNTASQRINRACAQLRSDPEKLPELVELAEHIEKHLRRYTHFYNPPSDFPKWEILF